MLESWTRAVLRARVFVLVAWLLILVVGVVAAARLPALLSNSLAVPGTDSAMAQKILAQDFHERREGTFTVVFETGSETRAVSGATVRVLQRRLRVAAHSLPGGHAGGVHEEEGIVYGEVRTALDLQHAKAWTDDLRRALREGTDPSGHSRAGDALRSVSPTVFVTGEPALQHDLDPILSADLRRGELIAIPITLLLLAIVLGLSVAVLVPFAFAACTVAVTLAALYLIGHAFSISAYAPNLIQLIGLGLAVDYSLLIVSRFREELGAGERTVEDAIVRTMATAGRAVAFSGLAVAIGLAVVLIMPVPFVRSLGLAGFLVPLFSIVAALTLQPVLLSFLGRRGVRRLHLPLPSLPAWASLRGKRETQPSGNRPDLWGRLTETIMRHPIAVLLAGAAVMLVAASPVRDLQLTPGSIAAIPQFTESARGLALLQDRFGPGAVTPIDVVIDTGAPGKARTPAARAATERLVSAISQHAEAFVTATGEGPSYIDASGRFRKVTVIGRHEYGAEPMQNLVRRLRSQAVPDARLPASLHVYVGGAPAQGVDFLDRVYGTFPWVVAVVLALTYLVLLRAFRSLLLPLKAVLLNVLSVLATYGLLVVVFRFGVGADVLGLYRIEQVEGWIPIFLFAMLFGLSMDYEVFMVSRMRVAWDELGDNERAVAEGLR
ncbi:MAG: MMPL family transporter, partial [Solirubrobacterales bacterium]